MAAFTLFLLAATTSAAISFFPSSNDFYGPPKYAPVLFEQAAHSPNVTNTVPFSLDNANGWEWRVNITNVAMRNASTTVPDAHIAYTTWDLHWPGDGSLDDELTTLPNASPGAAGPTLCAYVVYGPVASERYTDCSTAIGDECVQSMMSDLASDPVYQTNCNWNPVNLNGCGNVLGTTAAGYGVVRNRKSLCSAQAALLLAFADLTFP